MAEPKMSPSAQVMETHGRKKRLYSELMSLTAGRDMKGRAILREWTKVLDSL